MTLEEAKKILEKEIVFSFHSTKPFVFNESNWIEHEKPSVLEAFRVLAKEGYYVSISGHDYNMREKYLQKEYEQNTKASGHGEEQSEGKKGIIYPTTFPKADFYHKHVLKEDNPALKEAASQFNDALLDEQSKKIKHLTKKISRLNKIIHKKNEELRLTKIREKNLAELDLKYVGENEKLKKKLADKIVDEIDARALKSAESALAYKEKVIAEKDEVIADLGKELAAQKDLVDDISLKYDGAKYNLKLRMDECEKLKKQLDSNTNMVQKMAEIIVHKKPVTADVFKKCWIMAYSEEKLSKVLDDVIDQFLLFGEIIIKEEK